jgi:2-phosphoglycerate kinase
MPLEKPILLIGGAPGTGKSSLANHLVAALSLDHRIGTGFVRAIVQAESSPTREPLLFSRTFDVDDPLPHVIWQARRLLPAVVACIERARLEGTSLVVEGSHLLPSVYGGLPVDAFVVLAAPEEAAHKQQILGDTHSHRVVTDEQIARIRRIDSFYRSDAQKAGVVVLPGADLASLVCRVSELLKPPNQSAFG